MEKNANGKVILDLPTTEGLKFFYKPIYLEEIKKELDEFLENISYMQTKNFAESVMFSHEIRANDLVEGYTDDIALILEMEKKYASMPESAIKHRIMNLYRGYSYILQHKDINEESLNELYLILSRNLLSLYDVLRMGKHYRLKPVYLLKGGWLDLKPYEGVPAEDIESFIGYYFNFINTFKAESQTDEYIKSQIMHFYLMYIHPYYDVNGRISRTIAMWQLLNKEAYPYIIFNRGISYKYNEYNKRLEKARDYRDLTFFLKMMLETVKEELEKEYIINNCALNTSEKLSSIDYDTLQLFLTMKGLRTVKDFIHVYNRFNDKKRSQELYDERLVPLIDKGILEVERTTQKHVTPDMPNLVLRLNPKKIDNDPTKIKRIEL